MSTPRPSLLALLVVVRICEPPTDSGAHRISIGMPSTIPGRAGGGNQALTSTGERRDNSSVAQRLHWFRDAEDAKVRRLGRGGLECPIR